MPLRRPAATVFAAVSAAALLPLSLVGHAAAQPSAQPAEPTVQPAAQGAHQSVRTARGAGGYRATVTRTEHGIPHVVADSWGSSGSATATRPPRPTCATSRTRS